MKHQVKGVAHNDELILNFHLLYSSFQLYEALLASLSFLLWFMNPQLEAVFSGKKKSDKITAWPAQNTVTY